MSDVLSHVDEKGRARMVDVSSKDETHRLAVAKGRIRMEKKTLDLILSGGIEKGDVFAAARIAGIMGSKRTPDIIPMCHPIMITGCEVKFDADEEKGIVYIEASAKTTGKTGIEMEALTAVSIAALTIYDMCKAVDRTMTIEDIHLVKKSGGKSGEWNF